MSSDIRRIRGKLFHRLIRCYQGWWHWHWIVRRHAVDSTTAVVLLPAVHYNKDSYYALLYLDEMLLSRGFNSAIILSVDPVVEKVAQLFSRNIREARSISRKRAEQLMQYACLFTFDLRFIIASMSEPEGRKGETLVGKRGLTWEEVFCVGVYRIYPQEKNPPHYRGNDVEIKQFMKTGKKGR